MDLSALYSKYFPDEFCQKFSSELTQFLSENANIDSNLTRTYKEHLFAFTLTFGADSDSCNSFDNYSIILGGKITDPNLIKSEIIISTIFGSENLYTIREFLNTYDGTCFWNAFGLSEEEIIIYLPTLMEEDNCEKIESLFSDLSYTILSRNKLKKDYIINNIFPVFLNLKFRLNNFNLIFFINRFINENYSEKLKELNAILVYGINGIDTNILNHIQGDFPKQLSSNLIFDLFLLSFCIENPIFSMQILVFSGEKLSKYKLAFIIDKWGYEIYQSYKEACTLFNQECMLDISDEDFLYRPYPQLTSLYKRYFPNEDEHNAKAKTISCFTRLFEKLKSEQYIDNDCKLDNFLWAFGLLEEQPYFKKIAFHSKTPRGHIQGTAAFLQLLVQLGYSSDEIHQMQKEPSIINEIFDLNVTRKNKPGERDKKDLHQIVLDSGLPIVEDVEG